MAVKVPYQQDDNIFCYHFQDKFESINEALLIIMQREHENVYSHCCFHYPFFLQVVYVFMLSIRALNTLVIVILNSLHNNSNIYVMPGSGSDPCFVSSDCFYFPFSVPCNFLLKAQGVGK